MTLKAKNAVASAEERYKPGIWLGIEEKTSEILVANAEGEVEKSRSIRRMAESDRWDTEMVQAIRGRPHNLLGRETEQHIIFE